MKYIVDIKGEIEGDYEIIGKYEERPLDILNDSISNIKLVCKSSYSCTECPMNYNCNEPPSNWEVIENEDSDK